jgi:hypothetical protein
MSRAADEPLICPRCATTHPLDERFCPQCGMPLTYQAPAPDERDERRERARKVKRQYSEGDLVPVAHGRNLPEAELVQNLLLEEGVPSVVRRSRGFDVPEMLAAGPRDILVPRSGEATAREVLLQAELQDREGDAGPPPARLLAWLLAAVALVALIVWVAAALQG